MIDLKGGFPVIRAISARKGLSAGAAIKADRNDRDEHLAAGYRKTRK